MTKEIQILFQIDSVKRTSFYQKQIDGLDIGKLAQINLGLKFGINKEKSIVSTFVKVDFSQENKEFLGIEVVHNFKVKDNTVLDKCTPKNLNLPQKFLFTLASISISGTRGLLAGINITPPYNRFFLPLVNPKELLIKGKVLEN